MSQITQFVTEKQNEQYVYLFQKMSHLLHDVDVDTKKATFALACFWEPDAIYGAQKGVIRTRVGYSGGKKENPTYRDL
jgi:hypothetical protein